MVDWRNTLEERQSISYYILHWYCLPLYTVQATSWTVEIHNGREQATYKYSANMHKKDFSTLYWFEYRFRITVTYTLAKYAFRCHISILSLSISSRNEEIGFVWYVADAISRHFMTLLSAAALCVVTLSQNTAVLACPSTVCVCVCVWGGWWWVGWSRRHMYTRSGSGQKVSVCLCGQQTPTRGKFFLWPKGVL